MLYANRGTWVLRAPRCIARGREATGAHHGRPADKRSRRRSHAPADLTQHSTAQYNTAQLHGPFLAKNEYALHSTATSVPLARPRAVRKQNHGKVAQPAAVMPSQAKVSEPSIHPSIHRNNARPHGRRKRDGTGRSGCMIQSRRQERDITLEQVGQEDPCWRACMHARWGADKREMEKSDPPMGAGRCPCRAETEIR